MAKKSTALLVSSVSACVGLVVVFIVQRDRPDREVETQVFPRIASGASHSTFTASSAGGYRATGSAHFKSEADARIGDNWSCAVMDLETDGWVTSASLQNAYETTVTMEKSGYRLDMQRSEDSVKFTVVQKPATWTEQLAYLLNRLGVIRE